MRSTRQQTTAVTISPPSAPPALGSQNVARRSWSRANVRLNRDLVAPSAIYRQLIYTWTLVRRHGKASCTYGHRKSLPLTCCVQYRVCLYPHVAHRSPLTSHLRRPNSRVPPHASRKGFTRAHSPRLRRSQPHRPGGEKKSIETQRRSPCIIVTATVLRSLFPEATILGLACSPCFCVPVLSLSDTAALARLRRTASGDSHRVSDARQREVKPS
jgi:hypothetical protein